jgi:hypothetical protein
MSPPHGRKAKRVKSQMQWEYIGLEENVDVSLNQE